MGCRHSNFDGVCSYFDGNCYDDQEDNVGYDSEGYCVVEEDSEPSDSCIYYESDNDDEDSYGLGDEYDELED